jgi:hypothetical protein
MNSRNASALIPEAAKNLRSIRTIVVVRTVLADYFCPAFVHQPRSHRWKVAERNSRASGSGSIQIQRQSRSFPMFRMFRSNL